MLDSARACDAEGVAVAVFPELCLTGYSIDDLVMQDPLLDAVEAALGRLVVASADLLPVLMVGAPLRHGNRLFNCAVVIHRGRVLGVVFASAIDDPNTGYALTSQQVANAATAGVNSHSQVGTGPCE